MAARLNPRHTEMVKAKIQASQLVNRLQNHALGKLKGKAMTDSQVRAAQGLLNKVVSDAPKDVNNTHSGDVTINVNTGVKRAGD